MSFEITEIENSNIIAVEAKGKLTKEAYEEFVPTLEDAIILHGKIRILFSMHDFHGWDAGALWEDTKFAFQHFSDIERLAIVGESKWEHGMAIFCKPFTKAAIKYFDRSEIANAKEWIHEDE